MTTVADSLATIALKAREGAKARRKGTHEGERTDRQKRLYAMLGQLGHSKSGFADRLRLFQEHHDLPATGKPDRKTIDAINAAHAALKSGDREKRVPGSGKSSDRKEPTISDSERGKGGKKKYTKETQPRWEKGTPGIGGRWKPTDMPEKEAGKAQAVLKKLQGRPDLAKAFNDAAHKVDWLKEKFPDRRVDALIKEHIVDRLRHGEPKVEKGLFSEKEHPRWPEGTPGIGGQFRPKGMPDGAAKIAEKVLGLLKDRPELARGFNDAAKDVKWKKEKDPEGKTRELIKDTILSKIPDVRSAAIKPGEEVVVSRSHGDRKGRITSVHENGVDVDHGGGDSSTNVKQRNIVGAKGSTKSSALHHAVKDKLKKKGDDGYIVDRAMRKATFTTGDLAEGTESKEVGSHPPNLRKGSGAHVCARCVHWSEGTCNKYHTSTGAGQVCDSYDGAVTKSGSIPGMLDSVLATARQALPDPDKISGREDLVMKRRIDVESYTRRSPSGRIVNVSSYKRDVLTAIISKLTAGQTAKLPDGREVHLREGNVEVVHPETTTVANMQTGSAGGRYQVGSSQQKRKTSHGSVGGAVSEIRRSSAKSDRPNSFGGATSHRGPAAAERAEQRGGPVAAEVRSRQRAGGGGNVQDLVRSTGRYTGIRRQRGDSDRDVLEAGLAMAQNSGDREKAKQYRDALKQITPTLPDTLGRPGEKRLSWSNASPEQRAAMGGLAPPKARKYVARDLKSAGNPTADSAARKLVSGDPLTPVEHRAVSDQVADILGRNVGGHRRGTDAQSGFGDDEISAAGRSHYEAVATHLDENRPSREPRSVNLNTGRTNRPSRTGPARSSARGVTQEREQRMRQNRSRNRRLEGSPTVPRPQQRNTPVSQLADSTLQGIATDPTDPRQEQAAAELERRRGRARPSGPREGAAHAGIERALDQLIPGGRIEMPANTVPQDPRQLFKRILDDPNDSEAFDALASMSAEQLRQLTKRQRDNLNGRFTVRGMTEAAARVREAEDMEGGGSTTSRMGGDRAAARTQNLMNDARAASRARRRRTR